MRVRAVGIASSLVVTAAIAACTESRRIRFNDQAAPALSADGGDGDSGSGGNDFGGDFGDVIDAGDSDACVFNRGHSDPGTDYDGDGYALKDDCDECNKGINKGAYDIPANGIDEDCSGVVDDEPADCDGNLAIDTPDAFDGAKALGLCKHKSQDGKPLNSTREWGVVEAKWVMPDGVVLNDLRGVGVLPSFGVNAPRAGASMVALSSGFARAPGQPGYVASESHAKRYGSGTPAGYPKESPACPGVTTGGAHDGAGLELKIRVPSNVNSFSYQHFFFTYEYPFSVCTQYNDFFVTMVDPIPEGLPDGNIAFDQDGNPISVNSSLLRACAPGTHNGRTFTCPLGLGPLQGTGFDNLYRKSYGGTGWLSTTASVHPGSEISLRFTIWDSTDAHIDSTVILDDFNWSFSEADIVETKPADPK